MTDLDVLNSGGGAFGSAVSQAVSTRPEPAPFNARAEPLPPVSALLPARTSADRILAEWAINPPAATPTPAAPAPATGMAKVLELAKSRSPLGLPWGVVVALGAVGVVLYLRGRE